MAQELKAIQTQYKGYLFRSRLEARYAVFFDALGCPWEYEPEGFDLGPARFYLPDFWLPTVRMWGEVKPGPLAPAEEAKARALAELSRRPVLLLVGMPGPRTYMSFEGPAAAEWPDTNDYILGDEYLFDEQRFYGNTGFGPEQTGFDLTGHWQFSEHVMNAYQAARSARFEHGERGASV